VSKWKSQSEKCKIRAEIGKRKGSLFSLRRPILEENMEEVRELNEEIIIEKLRKLSSEKKQEILDFVEFLESREKSRGWVEFDEWAMNLAKEKGFARLTEQEVAEIVSDLRGGI
jgi:hypothetical protein